MSWSNIDTVREHLSEIISVLDICDDWRKESYDDECKKCPLYYYDDYEEVYKCRINSLYEALDCIDEEGSY